tara:strand:- start:2412 stop:3584 length:1173 start_codon:yes stop_codon:yes gene_type:complete
MGKDVPLPANSVFQNIQKPIPHTKLIARRDMSQKYFVRRNGTINGPLSVDKIQKLVEAKKLKPKDEIASTQKGPWENLGSSYKSVINGEFQNGINDLQGGEDDFMNALDQYESEGEVVSDDEYVSPHLKSIKSRKESREAALKAEEEERKSYSRERNRQIFTFAAWGLSLLAAGGGILFILFLMGDLFVVTADHHTTEAFEGLEKVLESKKKKKNREQRGKNNQSNNGERVQHNAQVNSDSKSIDASLLSGTYTIGNPDRTTSAVRSLKLKQLNSSQKSGFNSAQQAFEMVDLLFREGTITCELTVTRLGAPESNEFQCFIKSVKNMNPDPNDNLPSETRNALLKAKSSLTKGVVIVRLSQSKSNSTAEVTKELRNKLSMMRVYHIKVPK